MDNNLLFIKQGYNDNNNNVHTKQNKTIFNQISFKFHVINDKTKDEELKMEMFDSYIDCEIFFHKMPI